LKREKKKIRSKHRKNMESLDDSTILDFDNDGIIQEDEEHNRKGSSRFFSIYSNDMVNTTITKDKTGRRSFVGLEMIELAGRIPTATPAVVAVPLQDVMVSSSHSMHSSEGSHKSSNESSIKSSIKSSRNSSRNSKTGSRNSKNSSRNSKKTERISNNDDDDRNVSKKISNHPKAPPLATVLSSSSSLSPPAMMMRTIGESSYQTSQEQPSQEQPSQEQPSQEQPSQTFSNQSMAPLHGFRAPELTEVASVTMAAVHWRHQTAKHKKKREDDVSQSLSSSNRSSINSINTINTINTNSSIASERKKKKKKRKKKKSNINDIAADIEQSQQQNSNSPRNKKRQTIQFHVDNELDEIKF
jgi:hypothetical protein